jgi:hypothetical protein
MNRAGAPARDAVMVGMALMIAFQYGSQTATYRGMFPDAVYSIVAFGGEEVGRFIEHDETDVVYFVDFVLARLSG